MNPTSSDKFHDLIRLIELSKKKGLTILCLPDPRLLGDTYSEVMDNLHRIEEAGLLLKIGSPSDSSSTS